MYTLMQKVTDSMSNQVNQTDSSSWNSTGLEVHLQRMRYTLRTQMLMYVT